MRCQEPANTGLGSAGTGWVLWDVTTQVQQMYADSNNGFLLRVSAGDEPTRQRQVFSSRTVVMDEPADHVDAHDLVPSRALVPGQKTDGNRALDPVVRELYLDQRWHGFVGPEHLLSKDWGDVWVFGSDLHGGQSQKPNRQRLRASASCCRWKLSQTRRV